MPSTVKFGAPNWTKTHIRRYLETDGADGEFLDLSAVGAGPDCPTLILKTTGRKSGEARLAGLTYIEDDGGYVVIGSLGGAPKSPAWFLNLADNPEVEFQVGAAKYKGTATVMSGGRRAQLYARAAKRFPFYTEYQANTDREIPVAVLRATGTVESLGAVPQT